MIGALGGTSHNTQGESLYEMDMSANNVPVAMAGTTGGDADGCTWEDWHRAMGHISP